MKSEVQAEIKVSFNPVKIVIVFDSLGELQDFELRLSIPCEDLTHLALNQKATCGTIKNPQALKDRCGSMNLASLDRLRRQVHTQLGGNSLILYRE